MLSNIPNLVYLAPTCWEEYKAMLGWGIKQTEHPVAIVALGALEGGFGEKIARFYGNSDIKTLCFGIKKGLYDKITKCKYISNTIRIPP